jgi:hypothetical protein
LARKESACSKSRAARACETGSARLRRAERLTSQPGEAQFWRRSREKDKDLIDIHFSLKAVTGREPLATPVFVAEMSQEDQKRPGFH